MKKLWMALLLVLSFVLLCPTQSDAETVKKGKTTMYAGTSATISFSHAKIKSIKSSNKKVVTVKSDGRMYAKKAGKAVITVKLSNGSKWKETVTVKKSKVYLQEKTVKLKVKKKLKLHIKGSTIKKCKSSNKKVATVNNKGVVTAKKAGKATITVTAKNGKKYKCKIIVYKKLKTETGDEEPAESEEPVAPEDSTCKHGNAYMKEYKAAWDEKVIDQPEQTVTRQELVKEAWDETVTEEVCVQEAYDEEVCVGVTAIHNVTGECMDGVDTWTYCQTHNCKWHLNTYDTSKQSLCGSDTHSEWVYETVHHDAVYETQTRTIHHDAEYRTVTETIPEKYHIVHHDAIMKLWCPKCNAWVN